MKRILVMSIGTDLGGIEKSMIGFLQYLVGMPDVKVDLYLWRDPGPLYGMIPPQVNIITMPIGPCGLRECRTPRQLGHYLLFRALDAVHRGTLCFGRFPGEYDLAVAYCQVGYVPYYVIDKVTARRKVFFFHHGSYDERGLQRKVDARYYGRFDRVVTVSRANIEMLASHFPGIRDRLCAAGILLDADAIKAAGAMAEPGITADMASEPLLVTVARLSVEKGIDIAIDAARILKSRGLRFRWLFVGSGPSAADCRRRIADAGLDDVCILLGRRENPYAAIRRATIYVQPSRVESYSITIREAAVLGKPVVATSLAAIEEARDEIDGLRTVAPAPEALADAIGAMLQDPAGLAGGSYDTSFRGVVNTAAKAALTEILELNR